MASPLRMPPADQALYDPEVQTMAPEALRKLQEERVRKQITRVFDNLKAVAEAAGVVR